MKIFVLALVLFLQIYSILSRALRNEQNANEQHKKLEKLPYQAVDGSNRLRHSVSQGIPPL